MKLFQLEVVNVIEDRQVTRCGNDFAAGRTKYTMVVRTPAGNHYVVEIPRELAEEHQKSSITLDDDIRALFAWRDASTDYYGDDLAHLLMGEFGTDPYGSQSRREVPEDHKAALKKFQALSHTHQWELANMYASY